MPKLETIPTMMAADGRPWDVGTDHKLANNFNTLSDGKLLHQTPSMAAGTDLSDAGLTGFDNSVWKALFIFPLLFGTEHLGTSITRTLTIAPWFRCNFLSGTGYIRAVLMDRLPAMKPGVAEGEPDGGEYGDPSIPGRWSRSTEWSTDSLTWQQGTDYDLDLGTGKDIFFGRAFLMIEGAGPVECRGLATLREGARVVV